ncbi:type II toxin-antitoxin system RelE/ParE family toxin [Chthonobacter albigriseus]|uniref:type II toxin-antitoxin system RelE/ParE family toxin n=1 Tax=Chthonobacter albigriseus TaxID=1683161 RepID=UPI0015EF80FD|nr:type II toxin-antitoxin system RelE/ParE family toxin [Chthonobacter albigriseus]
MILGFANATTQDVHAGRCPKGFPTQVFTVARRKLVMLEQATILGDLRVPPGNRLEALSGNRVGQYSIRINDQFRICFVWTGRDADRVEIVDYH